MRARTIAILSGLLMLLAAGLPAQPGPFVPGTDATLQNPDPADWINWRRTRNAWGYSPLDQINRDFTCLRCPSRRVTDGAVT